MKKFAFVLMPFNPDFDDIYKLGIKGACNSEKIYCERVDEQIYEGDMLNRIYNQIQHADYIIADMTAKNPNVFYEVGYAHALQKKVILITQNPDDIPFDMQHYFHIVYNKSNISGLKDELNRRIEWYLSLSDETNNLDSEYELNVYLNSIQLSTEKLSKINILLRNKTISSLSYDFQLDLQLENPLMKIYDGKNTNVALEITDNFLYRTEEKMYPLPNGSVLLETDFEGKRIFPKSFWINRFKMKRSTPRDEVITGRIVISTPYLQQIYPFEIEYAIN